ncbi:MAG: heme lyase CcmF/NrfE family subunit, partial [Gammaproteobacteria bacterium]|nr:heme lyase CcmF/NrfE family subunit [Gammaproteobacteria bacterium]
VWGGHEGSMLLWSLMLATWTLAVAWRSSEQPLEFSSRVLAVLGIVAAGVLLFTIFTSNPFDRLLPAALDGRDLNPLLQDPAMVAHPPMLYVGYVGLAVPFAFAVAALLTGRLDRDWARWTRPWTSGAWIFLTLGISLGSWWAYYELGWGGWWFWDPVENASFMPWLMGTALIHSLAVTERRGIFKSWTVLLAIAAFSLSLLGTFLVRSGVLISVHAFASDPQRGLFILFLLILISGGALVLYALRAAQLESEGGFRAVSRESFLLANNVLLVIATIVILKGTLYPLFVDALGGGQISVGPPYFNLFFLLPMLPLALLLGLGMHAAWQKMSGTALLKRLRWPALAAAVLALVYPLVIFGSSSVLTFIGVGIGLWVTLSSLIEPIGRWLNSNAVRLTRAQLGMFIAHLGVGLFIIGASVTSAFNIETDNAVAIGDRWQVAGYEIEFLGMRTVEGPNFVADEGEFELRRDGEFIATLRPQKRIYNVQTNPMTEAAIDSRLFRDVFVALGEPLGNNTWSVRVQYKPMIGFIWFGCITMALGGLLAATDSRYRRKVKQRVPAPAGSADAASSAAIEQGSR